MRPGSLLEAKSSFQDIRIARHSWKPGEIILYCDGMWQFDSSIEHRYHEALATIPASAAEQLEHVLICGGGDGLCVRSLLQFPEAKSIELVEIDKLMIEIFRHPEFSRYNRESLSDPRTTVHIADAVEFAKTAPPEFYDLIILDFPSPGRKNRDKSYNKLFSPEVLRGFLRLLKPWGVLSAQVGLLSEALCDWVQTCQAEGMYVWQYDVAYDQYSSDAIAVASKVKLSQRRKLPTECRFATDERVAVGLSEETEIRRRSLDYYRLFESAQEVQDGDDESATLIDELVGED